MTASKAHTGLQASPRWPRHLILLAGVLVAAWIPFRASSTSSAPADGITIQYAAPVLIDSFDYLNFDPGDDAQATLRLHRVTIESAPEPEDVVP